MVKWNIKENAYSCSDGSELVISYFLQTIKNSDLEYIKELGSGTYGTVSYGKWKGSDVAIKRIKPSCFTQNTLEKDRLVIFHHYGTFQFLSSFNE